MIHHVCVWCTKTFVNICMANTGWRAAPTYPLYSFYVPYISINSHEKLPPWIFPEFVPHLSSFRVISLLRCLQCVLLAAIILMCSDGCPPMNRSTGILRLCFLVFGLARGPLNGCESTLMCSWQSLFSILSVGLVYGWGSVAGREMDHWSLHLLLID